MKTAQMLLLETISKINESLKSDPNALTCTMNGDVAPERAYCELIQKLVACVTE